MVDHDTGRLVWASPEREEDLGTFFDDLGQERAGQLTLSAPTAPPGSPTGRAALPQRDAVHGPVPRRAAGPPARSTRSAAQVWNRPPGRQPTLARELKGARWALWKNPEDLTGASASSSPGSPRSTARSIGPTYSKNSCGRCSSSRRPQAVACSTPATWARRCRIPAFVEARPIRQRPPRRIQATLLHGLSNALVESVNTKLRLLTRRAFGFHSPHALIGLAMLALGGLCPPLPGRPDGPTDAQKSLFSAAYLDSDHGEAEWRAFYAKDPSGERGRLLPVRVGDVEPPGLLTTRIYVDLVGRDGASARSALLAAARGARGKPAEEPEFPGAQQSQVSATEAPRFRGNCHRFGTCPSTPTRSSSAAARCWLIWSLGSTRPTGPSLSA